MYLLMYAQSCLKEIGDSIEEGVLAFGKKLKGFDRNDAILSGVEEPYFFAGKNRTKP